MVVVKEQEYELVVYWVEGVYGYDTVLVESGSGVKVDESVFRSFVRDGEMERGSAGATLEDLKEDDGLFGLVERYKQTYGENNVRVKYDIIPNNVPENLKTTGMGYGEKGDTWSRIEKLTELVALMRNEPKEVNGIKIEYYDIEKHDISMFETEELTTTHVIIEDGEINGKLIMEVNGGELWIHWLEVIGGGTWEKVIDTVKGQEWASKTLNVEMGMEEAVKERNFWGKYGATYLTESHIVIEL